MLPGKRAIYIIIRSEPPERSRGHIRFGELVFDEDEIVYGPDNVLLYRHAWDENDHEYILIIGWKVGAPYERVASGRTELVVEVECLSEMNRQGFEERFREKTGLPVALFNGD